ncbi:hypothetical protein [Candidatus Microthrix parvicella]|uniref:hypothetical protein n=1 Tax=Candidatus Neomicrothrix parvicella TaxID=41950 RepID=UPI0012FDC0D4|nr:hypothetical protein [Candidatus Microthrix parvicella]
MYRKAVYRKVVMRRLGASAGSHVPPRRRVDYRTELLGPDRFDLILATNPHLERSDLDHFHRQRSTCIAVYDGDRIASSSWMTAGSVYHHELQRQIEVPHDQHFSCRSYVDPDYRGQSLFAHMVYTYAQRVPAAQLVWGLVYAWNKASLKSLESVGWEHFGEEWSTYVLGVQRAGSSDVSMKSDGGPPQP